MLRILTKSGGDAEAPEAFEWIGCPTSAVLLLAPLSLRHLRKACKGPKKEARTPKSTGRKDSARGAGGDDGRVYVTLADGSAVDMLWLASVLPMHVLNTLISEELPRAAEGAGAAKDGGKGCPDGWFAYIAKCMHLLFCLVQLGIDYPAVLSTLLSQYDPAATARAGGNAGDESRSPALLVDVLLFSHTVALAMRYSADVDDESQAMLASAPSTDVAALPSVPGESGDGRAMVDDDESAISGVAGGSSEEDASIGGSRPIDVAGMVLQSMALLLRTEHSSENRPFRSHLVGHPKVTKVLCHGIFDAMDECFEQMTKDASAAGRRRRELKTFVEAAMEALFFCCTSQVFVADLLVCPYMRYGRALSVLKKVLYVEHVECVSLMLRWLLLFCEYEDPPSVDVLAGYDLYNGLLLSVMDRNNDAMVAWGVKSPMNPIALDLLKAVEVFADDSNFKEGVIDTSARAVATVLKRGPEYNGFNKSDRIHLPFTRAFFKLLAAMHCFNPDIMPPEQKVARTCELVPARAPSLLSRASFTSVSVAMGGPIAPSPAPARAAAALMHQRVCAEPPGAGHPERVQSLERGRLARGRGLLGKPH